MGPKNMKIKFLRSKKLPSEQLAHYEEGVVVGEGNATFEGTGATLPNDMVQAPLKSLTER